MTRKRNQISVDLEESIYIRLIEETRERGCQSVQEMLRVILGERYENG